MITLITKTNATQNRDITICKGEFLWWRYKYKSFGRYLLFNVLRKLVNLREEPFRPEE